MRPAQEGQSDGASPQDNLRPASCRRRTGAGSERRRGGAARSRRPSHRARSALRAGRRAEALLALPPLRRFEVRRPGPGPSPSPSRSPAECDAASRGCTPRDAPTGAAFVAVSSCVALGEQPPLAGWLAAAGTCAWPWSRVGGACCSARALRCGSCPCGSRTCPRARSGWLDAVAGAASLPRCLDAVAAAGLPGSSSRGAVAGGGGLRHGRAARLRAGLRPCASGADRGAHEAPLV